MGALNIGHKTYGTVTRRGNMNTVNIGKYCSLATGIIVDCGFNHNVDFISTYPFHTFTGEGEPNVTCKGDINIGNDVWIGEDVLIMSGVTIGDGAIIGARSVITKDVEPYSIVVGNDRVVRKRFNDLQISVLLAVKWWDWSDEKVIENAKYLSSKNILEFLSQNYL